MSLQFTHFNLDVDFLIVIMIIRYEIIIVLIVIIVRITTGREILIKKGGTLLFIRFKSTIYFIIIYRQHIRRAQIIHYPCRRQNMLVYNVTGEKAIA